MGKKMYITYDGDEDNEYPACHDSISEAIENTEYKEEDGSVEIFEANLKPLGYFLSKSSYKKVKKGKKV